MAGFDSPTDYFYTSLRAFIYAGFGRLVIANKNPAQSKSQSKPVKDIKGGTLPHLCNLEIPHVRTDKVLFFCLFWCHPFIFLAKNCTPHIGRGVTLFSAKFLKILPILHLWVKGPGKTTDDLRMVRVSDRGCRQSATGRFTDDLTRFHAHVLEGHKLYQKTVFISQTIKLSSKA